MPTSTPTTFHRNVPPCNLSHILLPHPILFLPFHIAANLFVFFSSTSDPPRLLPLLAQHLSAGLLPLLHASSQQSPKKTCNPSHPAHLPSFFASQHAYTHLRSIIYVSITHGGIYLAPKRRICQGREAPEHPKTPFVVVSNTLS